MAIIYDFTLNEYNILDIMRYIYNAINQKSHCHSAKMTAALIKLTSC